MHAVDDGGTANGGVDTSAAQTFTIQVSGVPDPPVAVDDGVSVNEDDTAGVTFDVLANDSDPDGDTVTLDSFDGSSIANGTLTTNGGGSFTYLPDPAFFGSETFTYTVVDGNGGTASAGVTITVVAQPDDPVAGADAYTTAQSTDLTVSAPGVLVNDYDEDGDGLTVVTSVVVGPTNGLALLQSDGSFVYTPDPLFVGTDTFTYRIGDGTGRTSDGLVTITVDSTVSSATLYLQPTGPSANVWDISAAAPPAATPVPDHDGDGDQGLTIKASNGWESEPDRGSTRSGAMWWARRCSSTAPSGSSSGARQSTSRPTRTATPISICTTAPPAGQPASRLRRRTCMSSTGTARQQTGSTTSSRSDR